MSLNLEQFACRTEFPVIDAGKYEVVLKIEKKWTKDNSKDFANCDFLIRNDEAAINSNELNKKWAGSHVFNKIFRDKSNPEWFDLSHLGDLLVTQKGRPDYKTNFDEVDELIQFLNNSVLTIEVEKTYDDYFQKEVNKVKRYNSYNPTTLGAYVAPVASSEQKPVAAAHNTSAIEVDDNDLPF